MVSQDFQPALLTRPVKKLKSLTTDTQATPVIAGAAIAAAAYAGKLSIEVFQKWKTAPPRLRQFYKVSCVLRMAAFVLDL